MELPATEARPDDRRALDCLTPAELAARLQACDAEAVAAVRAAGPAIARAIELARDALSGGGRLVLAGAGTSGRLAALEAAECGPTFSTDRVVALIAGGAPALLAAQEGAEDDAGAGARDVIALAVSEHDLVIGVSASGRTPYVQGALGAARARGARTALLTCAPVGEPGADVLVLLPTGPEALAGSTRLKAGTATKCALNAITTGAMSLLGKVMDDLMVDVRPTNRKLRERARRIVEALVPCGPGEGEALLAAAGEEPKTAVAMGRLGLDAAAARARLAAAGGHLRRALAAPGPGEGRGDGAGGAAAGGEPGSAPGARAHSPTERAQRATEGAGGAGSAGGAHGRDLAERAQRATEGDRSSRVDELAAIARKEARLIVGLMSGTSLDGVDAALCEVSGSGASTRVRLLAFETYPYPAALRGRIEDAIAGTAADVCEVSFVLGGALADAAVGVVERAGASLASVDLVASHGQTIHHVDPSRGVASTLQVGEASVIAERTGRIVVCDFRTRDVAAGGRGAPLVAYLDQVLFARPGRVRLLQNVGGMANVTVVTERPEDLLAFDTGPGNVLIDEVCRELTGDEEAFDRDGSLSRLGEVDEGLLARLMANEYLALPPPKTTGREVFGLELAQALVEEYDRARLIDLLATVVRFTAASIADAYRRFVLPRFPRPDDVVVTGGGAHNRTLMAALREELPGLEVRPLDPAELGFPGDAKEAVAFAVLANETVQGRASNVPAATGARRGVILGKIVL